MFQHIAGMECWALVEELGLGKAERQEAGSAAEGAYPA